MATYNITTLQELQDINSGHLADDCVLQNDIDATDTAEWNPISGEPDQFYGFIPIGTDSTPFTGSFDGQGYTIKNLYINNDRTDSEYHVGLFGKASLAADAAVFGNVEITGATVINRYTQPVGIFCGTLSGKSSTERCVIDSVDTNGTLSSPTTGTTVGGVIGSMTNATVTNCSSNIAISKTCDSAGSTYTGGFAGYIYASDLTDCVAGGSLTIDIESGANRDENIGGFAGYIPRGSTANEQSVLTQCVANVAIVSDNQYSSQDNLVYIGGFIGNAQYGANSADISKCGANASIVESGDSFYMIGGFAGYCNSLDECYASGSIEAQNATAGPAGGLLVGGFQGGTGTCSNCYARVDVCRLTADAALFLGGFIGSALTVTNCYSTGYVYPGTQSGGFAGKAASGTRTSCYWDTENSGMTTGVGDGDSQTGVTGKTTDEMKTEATFSGWDFDAIWDIASYTQPAINKSNLTVWVSAKNDYDNFEEGLNDSDAFSLVIPTTNEIKWANALDHLVIGTSAGEWRISSNKLDTPMSPSNYSVRRQTTYGSKAIQAIAVNTAILYVDFVGRKLREMTFTPGQDKYTSPDLTELAEHITDSGVTCIDYQRNPESTVWAVLDNGEIISMVYNREQEVVAWSSHIIGGTDVVVQSLCVVPGTTEDAVWLTVSRTINGATKVYIEKMMPRDWGSDQEDAFFVDSGLTYDSTPTGTLTGLDHLEGETVQIWGDGVVYDEQTVTSGEVPVELDGSGDTVSVAQVGLEYTYILQPTRIVLGGTDNTNFGIEQRVNDLFLRFLDSMAVSYGKDTDNLFAVDFPDTDLYTGDIKVHMDGGFSYDSPIVISGSDPAPCNVACIIANIDTTG